MNTSIFVIDGLIHISNGMIMILKSSLPIVSVWDTLSHLIQQAPTTSLAVLLLMLCFLVLSVILLVYYVTRLITLFIGAILSPLVLLLWLIPLFRDFTVAAFKTYLITIFILFVHVVILLLAASLFAGMSHTDSTQPNTLMSLITGLATLMALLKTQSVIKELSFVTSTPKAIHELGGSFLRTANAFSNSLHQNPLKNLPQQNSHYLIKMRNISSSSHTAKASQPSTKSYT